MTVQTQIEELAQNKLLGKRIHPVSFVDDLLALASEEGEIQCTFASNEALRFTISGRQLVFDVQVDRARGKLRMMCARLAKLCQDSGEEFLPYGGEGIVTEGAALASRRMSESTEENNCLAIATPQLSTVTTADGAVRSVAQPVPASLQQPRWKARWKNTMHEQEFIIQAL